MLVRQEEAKGMPFFLQGKRNERERESHRKSNLFSVPVSRFKPHICKAYLIVEERLEEELLPHSLLRTMREDTVTAGK